MDHVNTLAIARIALGTGFWATPELSLKLGLLDPDAPQAPYLGRMFAAREIALGLVTLLARPEQKKALTGLGIAVDSADTAAAVLAIRSRGVTPGRGAVLAGVAAAAAVTGVLGLAQQRSAQA